MALLGLLLMLGAAAVAADAVIQNTQLADAVLFNHHFSASLGASFVTGCVVGLLFALGLAMFLGGFTRGIRARRERRALRRDTAEAEALRERNAALENRLATQDNAYPNDPATTTTGSTTTADETAGRHRV
jgi:predicted phage tail protein